MARSPTTDLATLAWQGEAQLWRMFWLWTMGAAVVLALLLSLIPAGAVRWTIGVIMGVPYFSWALIGVWRCAPNSRWAGWGYGTRALLLIALIVFLSKYIGRSTIF